MHILMHEGQMGHINSFGTALA